MGMFDYVKCEVPLPDGFEGELQTKDFANPYMETYTITKDGRLLRRYIVDHKPVPEGEWEYSADDPNPLHRIWHEHSKTRPVLAEEDVEYHGWLNFYGYSGDVNDRYKPGGEYQWHEYNAKFTDGRLVTIEVQLPRVELDKR